MDVCMRSCYIQFEDSVRALYRGETVKKEKEKSKKNKMQKH